MERKREREGEREGWNNSQYKAKEVEHSCPLFAKRYRVKRLITCTDDSSIIVVGGAALCHGGSTRTLKEAHFGSFATNVA